MVVHSFVNKSLALNHVAIRHNISNLLDNPVIVFLKKFEHGKNDPKVMIQFAQSSSVDTLLDKWNPATERCEIRRPRRPTPRTDGICFGVPQAISEIDLLEHVKKSYSSCDRVIRFLTKNKTVTGTVKIIFKDMAELCDAVSNKIYIQDFCLKLVVERARPPKPRSPPVL